MRVRVRPDPHCVSKKFWKDDAAPHKIFEKLITELLEEIKVKAG